MGFAAMHNDYIEQLISHIILVSPQYCYVSRIPTLDQVLAMLETLILHYKTIKH